MSFFDNNKHVGLALIIVGLIVLILGLIAAIANGISDNFTNTQKLGYVITAIGSLIFGILILGFGLSVRRGSNDKVAILSGLVRVIGIATILAAIFSAVGNYLINDDGIGAAIVAFIVQIIIGLILIWVAHKIGGKSKNVISKVLWLILLIVFAILAILSIVNCITGILHDSSLGGILTAISLLCWFIVYVYAVIALLSPEVKSSMGI